MRRIMFAATYPTLKLVNGAVTVDPGFWR